MRLVDKAIKLAKKRRINQAEFAAMIGVYAPRISEWKRGEGAPSLDIVLRMARILGVPMEYLVDDAMESPPPDLTADEEHVLRVFRALKIPADEVVRRMAGAAAAGVVGGEIPGTTSQADDPQGGEPPPHGKRTPRRLA